MNYSRILVLLSIPLLLVNLYAVTYNLPLLVTLSSFGIYIPLLAGFWGKLDLNNINIVGFIGLSGIGTLLFIYEQHSYLRLAAILVSMFSYIFLIREALKYTRRENANKFMLAFFFIIIAVNVYYAFGHIQELETYIASIMEYAVYSIYYLNLFVLALVALVYYLNSYSRKSVYFISLVIALVVSNILRDMAFFYLPDTSVLLLNSFLQFGAILLSFQFFITEEKKLRLINLL
ncbi:hypothetical protein [Christiangramia aquimixticola]|uniref:hypothetical protein n=1 Tax=Christiangramia aquimixticola TaxID=1697558 RepID=UPI003AA80B70